MTNAERSCPGCGLVMPAGGPAAAHAYLNASPECWGVYGEVLAAEYGNAVLFGQVHQLTVDAYAVQHAGGIHPDKSVGIHLCGLLLVLERGLRPSTIPPLLQRLASDVAAWPHFTPPEQRGALTVFDVALCDSVTDHIDASRRWAESVWASWSMHHGAVAALADRYLGRG